MAKIKKTTDRNSTIKATCAGAFGEVEILTTCVEFMDPTDDDLAKARKHLKETGHTIYIDRLVIDILELEG